MCLQKGVFNLISSLSDLFSWHWRLILRTFSENLGPTPEGNTNFPSSALCHRHYVSSSQLFYNSLLVIIHMLSCQTVGFNKDQLCKRTRWNEKFEHNIKATRQYICYCTAVIFHWISSSTVVLIRTNKRFLIWLIIHNKHPNAFALLYRSVITAINLFSSTQVVVLNQYYI